MDTVLLSLNISINSLFSSHGLGIAALTQAWQRTLDVNSYVDAHTFPLAIFPAPIQDFSDGIAVYLACCSS
ncbi:MAG: hypothetical protein Q8O19_08265 [Rectinemataceae bacterium]|nr:hypothetical protein [Rectinemataceae bacterium]